MEKKVLQRTHYSEEEKAILIAKYSNMPNKELGILLNRSEFSVSSAAYKLGLKKSPEQLSRNGALAVQCPYLDEHSKARALAGRYQKGCKPWTTGRKLSEEHKAKITSTFKKGSAPHNTRPDGTISKIAGVLHIKLGYKNWKSIARIRWEELHGPIPKDMILFRLDGNKENDEISNLCLITRQDLVILNRNHAKIPQELKELQILINQIKRKANESNKR